MKIPLKIILLIMFLNLTVFIRPAVGAQDDIDLVIGQMLMVGFRGCDLSSDAMILRDIKEHNLGGVVLFDYDVKLKKKNRNIENPQQLKALAGKLSDNAKTPLFIAIDMEGGRVNRLKEAYGFPKTFSAQYLGDLNDIERITAEASSIGKTLHELGINLNFAPVVDININPDSPAIGKIERSFSSDPQKVSEFAGAFIDGLHNNNILSCIKHFPGHGSSYNDSHYGITDVTDTWKNIELIPYENFIKSEKNDLIMTAHIFNKNFDAKYPATLSKKVITGILREKLGYNGVVITDDMQMKAIKKYYGLRKAIYLAIDAGADIILFGNNLTYDPAIIKKAVKIIKQLVKENRISKERLLESYDRITKLKKKLVQ